MKIYLYAAAALAGLSLASCHKSKTPTVLIDRAVTVSIDRGATRGIGVPVGDQSDVIFSSGWLLFTNSAEIVTLAVAIEDNTDAYSEADLTVGLGALEATNGAQIDGVPGSTSTVYFAANLPSGVNPGVGDNVNAYLATIESQYAADGGVTNASLWGGGALTPSTATGAALNEFEAAFTVRPIVGRFEIAKITGTPSAGATTFTYTIHGIFIDNFYSSMSLAGAALDADRENNSAAQALYAPDVVGGSYTTARAGVMYNYDATTGLANNTTFAPAAGKVWAYNLLAPTLSDETVEMPALVIAVSNVVVDGTSWPGEHYLTASTFYSDPGTNLVPIAKLDQGRVYVISDLTFDETDLTTTPYVKNKQVAVTIGLMKWESKEIGWDL